MPSAVSEVETTAPPPTTPVCVRSKSLHPHPVHSPHRMPRSPFVRSPHKPLWPQESVPQPLFPVERGMDSMDGYTMNEHGIEAGRIHGSYVPSSTTASTMPVGHPQFHHRGPAPIHLLSEPGDFEGSRMDPRAMQRTHSDPAAFGGPGSHFLYYHQVAGPDQYPIAWSAREAALRSPPAPRQRSAKACKKCRKRKTKCSGGLPCARCVARGLECEYDEKSTLRGPMKGRAQPPPMVPTNSASSDSALRSSSKGERRHQPYPARSPSRPSSAMGHSSSQDGSVPRASQVPQSAMLHLLGITSNGVDNIPENAGYPTYGVPPMPDALLRHHNMGMSATVDPAFVRVAGGGYPMAMPAMQQGGQMGMNWGRRTTTEEGDLSDSSRPASACSGSSFSSSDGSYIIDSAQPGVVWPSSIPDQFHTAAVPPPLSTSSSSSSLKDALVEVPRPHRPSPPASAATRSSVPVATVRARDPTAAEFAASLTNILNNACITDVAMEDGAPLPPSPPNSASAFSPSTPESGSTWSSAVPSPVTPSSPLELQFEDVFNLSPSTSGISPSVSIASVVSEVANSTSWSALSPGSTIRAKGELSQSPRGSERVSDDTPLNCSTPSADLKTPRAMQIFRFDGQAVDSSSTPGYTSLLSQA